MSTHKASGGLLLRAQDIMDCLPESRARITVAAQAGVQPLHLNVGASGIQRCVILYAPICFSDN